MSRAFGNASLVALGLLSFHVDDRRELIRIFDVTWAG
jgi:hypothetical protein